MSWLVYDPLDGCVETFADEADALAHAALLIDQSLDDGLWDESVECIVVAKVTHTARKRILAVRSEMSEEEWAQRAPLHADRLCEELCDYEMVESR